MDATESNRRLARAGAIGFAVIAILCAGFAAFLASRIMQARGLEQERKLPVVVTTRAIGAAEPIPRDALKLASWPESNLPPGALSSIEGLYKDGRAPVAAAGIQAGEPIVRARLADPARGTAMAALVQPGYRAVAVKVDNAIARAGLLYPGASVDVVGTVRDSKTFVVSSRILVENVRVLSVEARTDVETYRPKAAAENGSSATSQERQDAVVTIEVTPEQSELVVLAEREGKVDLPLRNASDVAPVKTSGVTPSRLAAVGAAASAAHASSAATAEQREARRLRRRPDERARPQAPGIETYRAP